MIIKTLQPIFNISFSFIALMGLSACDGNSNSQTSPSLYVNKSDRILSDNSDWDIYGEQIASGTGFSDATGSQASVGTMFSSDTFGFLIFNHVPSSLWGPQSW